MDSVRIATTLPFPQKSHINPMMNLAQYLASLQVHGRTASDDIRKKILEHVAQFSGNPYLRVVVVPKGLADEDTSGRVNALILKESLSAMAKHLESVIEEENRSERPVTCLFCDILSGTWPQDLADKFGIPRVDFSTLTATNYMLCWNLRPLIISRVTENRAVVQADVDTILTSCVPGVHPALRVNDLPSYFVQGQLTDAFQLEVDCEHAYGRGKDAEWVLIHTYYELERSVIDALRAERVPVHAVGPLLPPSVAGNASSAQSSAEDVNGTASSRRIESLLLGHTDECLRWLDTQSRSSVLYVALRTTGSWSPGEIEALAYGVEDSQMPFLWVLPPIMPMDGSPKSSFSDISPEGFADRTKLRSLMVPRAPQLAVLAPPSVGGFLTHCEWNSILEGMYYGVPMAGIAGSADQLVSLRLMMHKWKVGVGIERLMDGGGVQRRDVEATLRQVMRRRAGHHEDEDTRRAVAEAPSLAVRHSRSAGGSKTSLDTFVRGLWDVCGGGGHRKECGRLNMDDGWTKVMWGQKGQKSPTPTPSHATAVSNRFAVLATLPPTDLLDLVDRLEGGLKEWVKNDNVLLRILLHVFEANWSKARACLTMDTWPSSIQEPPPHALGIMLMQAMVDMRGRKWDAFAKKILPKIQIEGLSIGRALGCECVTSDIDISLKGNNTEIGVGLISQAFREEFGVPFEPATVFDINVYCIDWMHGQTEINRDVNSLVASFKPEPEPRGVQLSPEDSEARSDILEMWSLVKIRRNVMHPEQWDTYKQTILAALKDGNAIHAMKKKLIDAESEYQSFRMRLKTQMQVMDATLRHQEAQLGYQEEHSAFGHANKEYACEAREMRASNALYHEAALRARDLRTRLDTLRAHDHPQNAKEISNVIKQLSFTIAEGLTYANEAYTTEGAVLHTVYGKQEAKSKLAELQAEGRRKLIAVQFALTQEHYLQSLNENVGDVLHVLKQFQTQPQYAVYRAGKYMERLCEAAESLLSNGVSSRLLISYAQLKEIAMQSVRAKAHDVGRDPKAVFFDIYFRQFWRPAHLHSLSLHVIKLGATASALFHNSNYNCRNCVN